MKNMSRTLVFSDEKLSGNALGFIKVILRDNAKNNKGMCKGILV